MKHKRHILLGLLVVSLVGFTLVVRAGYEHSGGTSSRRGSTKWAKRAGPATCWLRDRRRDEIYPAAAVYVFQDSIRLLQAGGTNMTVSVGLCEIDSSGDYMPIAATVDMYTRRSNLGARTGVELELDSNGDIMSKL